MISENIQVTHELGYDGGSFFSPDGKRLVFRASRPKTADEIEKYKVKALQIAPAVRLFFQTAFPF